jgi:Ca2+/Na+ antiporter
LKLFVIVTCLSQNNSALALGNLMGSSIANILASFALGLFFSSTVEFDQSARIYTGILLGLTTVFLIFLCTLNYGISWVAGIFLIMTFVLYVVSVTTMIVRGVLHAPENDSDDSSSDDSDGDSDDDGRNDIVSDESSGLSSSMRKSLYRNRASSVANGYGTRSKPSSSTRKPTTPPRAKRPAPKTLRYHVIQLFMGLIALFLSSYIISHSGATIGAALSLSSTVVGTTVLSFATTLPEKFVAIMSGIRKQPGIIVATNVGSNIFLVTLCGGVIFLAGDPDQLRGAFTTFEASAMWCSSAVISFLVLGKTNKMAGLGLLCCYVAFVLYEFSSGRQLDDD